MTATHTAPTTTFDLRRLHVGDEAYLPALRLIFGEASGQHDDTVSELLGSMAGGPTKLGLVFAAFEHGRVVSACAVVTSPGRSGLVVLPPEMPAASTAALLSLQARAAWSQGVRLLEILARPGDESASGIFARSGYRQLTSLIYLRKRLDGPTPAPRDAELSWANWSEHTAAAFTQAIVDSYEQSLDCPELSDLRTVEDAIAGHRATGDFDPSLWWVVRRGDRPVGLILLSRFRSRQDVEVVYMGVSASARGSGVGNALLAQGFHCAARTGAKTVALAVDQRNRPARDLYHRSGFIEVGLRDAWIATPREEDTSSGEPKC